MPLPIVSRGSGPLRPQPPTPAVAASSPAPAAARSTVRRRTRTRSARTGALFPRPGRCGAPGRWRLPSVGVSRSYAVRTYGCQMNVHDSERMAGLLEQAGYDRAADPDSADVVVFNTCAVRENADNKLYGNLGHLRPAKQANPDMQIAVGGCLAQKDRETIVRKAPWVDVVFGTHNVHALPTLLERARHNARAEVEIAESLEVFPSTLPARRESAYAGWVSISVGCNNTCTFCIVPSLRGAERDRRPGDVLAEVEALVADGVLEVTLLGQNVNAYGVDFGEKGAFAQLLRACGDVEGLERVRFTSPHPRDFTSDVIAAMAETPNVCPQLHMPLQSGSDDVLRRMRRSYRSARFLRILADVRESIPDAAISTDIIVGFPGETDADFEATLDVVREARFAQAFTFQYSPRPGTPGRVTGRPVTQARRPGTLRAARRGAGGDLLGGQPRAGGPRAGGARVHRRGSQGRRDASAVRSRPRRQARALRARFLRRPPRRRRDGPGRLRRAAPPARRRRRAVAPADPRRRRARGRAASRRCADRARAPVVRVPAAPRNRPTPAVRRSAGVRWRPRTAARSAEVPEELRALNEELAGPPEAGRAALRPGRPGGRRRRRRPRARRVPSCCRGSRAAPAGRSRSGQATYGPLPRLFTFTLLGFGVAGSVLALFTRWWPLAWVCAIGCGISTVNGIWAIWSRQIGADVGLPGPQIGMVLGVLGVLVLTFTWAGIALRR